MIFLYVCPIWKIVLLPKNIEIENSKMVSQAYIVLKMSPTDAILMKNENCNFTKFVNFFISQFILAQKFYERLGIASIFFSEGPFGTSWTSPKIFWVWGLYYLRGPGPTKCSKIGHNSRNWCGYGHKKLLIICLQ